MRSHSPQGKAVKNKNKNDEDGLDHSSTSGKLHAHSHFIPRQSHTHEENEHGDGRDPKLILLFLKASLAGA